MKHKHSELIKAWADGATVQVRLDNHWEDTECPIWHPDSEYRVKPQTLKYRVALFSSLKGEKYIVTASTPTLAPEGFERDAGFIRWLTDWVEVEV